MPCWVIDAISIRHSITLTHSNAMASNTTTPTPVPEDKPLDNFSHCHDGIIKNLKTMDSLPELAEQRTKPAWWPTGCATFSGM